MSVCLIVFFLRFSVVSSELSFTTSPVILARSLVEKIKKLQARELLPLIIEICESPTEGTDDN